MKPLTTKINNCLLATLTLAIIAIIGGLAGAQIIAHIFGFLALGFLHRAGLHYDVIWRRKYGAIQWG